MVATLQAGSVIWTRCRGDPELAAALTTTPRARLDDGLIGIRYLCPKLSDSHYTPPPYPSESRS